MNTFKSITGGTKEDAYNKFPWLEKADFMDAIIDITEPNLVWKGGVWKSGVWKGGVWEGGDIWSNIQQSFIAIKEYKNDKFIPKTYD